MMPVTAWLAAQEKLTAPLFDTEDDGVTVRTHRRGTHLDRVTLTRHPAFDAAMIDMVEAGLRDPEWHGFLYVMQTGAGESVVPRYIGKAEKRGVKNAVSANLLRIRTDHAKFGRWGYNRAYHIGELSHAVLGEAFGPGTPARSYVRWRDALFEAVHPPTLKVPVQMHLIPWRTGMRGPSGLVGSVAAVEYEVIALAAHAFPDHLLNIHGR